MCTYVPNSSLQLWLMCRPVIIVCGLKALCIPSLRGKLFSQKMILYIISTISLCRYVSNGSWFTIAQTISFTVLINRSNTCMCSFHQVVLRFASESERNFLMCSNCPSLCMCFILNPHLWYICNYCLLMWQ